MSKIITGVIPPIITSFDKDGNFDEKAQREVVRFLVDKVNGFYPTGSYGCGPLMTVEERKRVAEVVIDEVNGKIPVIIMVGSPSTNQAVELAKHAESIGADAVGAIPPYYNIYPESMLMGYFRDIMAAVSLPVFVYNNPKLSNNTITPAMLRTLADEGLAGLKDSAFSLTTFYEFLLGVPTSEYPDFYHIVGTEAIAAGAVNSGAKAIISGLANVWPELMAELWAAIESNDAKKAGELQLRVYKARAIMKLAPTTVVCYEALKMRGINAGFPRKPYTLLSDEVRAKVKAGFTEMGLFNQ